MKYQIWPWHGVTENFLSIDGLHQEKVIDEGKEIERYFAEIGDLQKFSEKHGNIMLWKPKQPSQCWIVLLDDKYGNFRQR